MTQFCLRWRRTRSSYRPAPLLDGEDSRAWLRHWLPLVTRPLRHPGNHKFCWPLDKAVRRHLARLEPAGPYPKEVDRVDA